MTVRRARVAAFTVGGVLALLVVGVAGLRISHQGILPGVSVEGLDLGGASEAHAREQLTSLAAARASEPVTLTFADRTFEVTPDEVGYGVDVEATLARAREPGREGGFFGRTWDHVAALWRHTDIDLVERIGESALRERVDAIAAEVDAAPFPGALRTDPASLTVTTLPPGPGVEVDRDATADTIRRALAQPGTEQLELPTTVVPARVAPDDVEEVGAQARRALEAPLTLRANGADISLEPSQLASMLALREVAAGPGDDTGWTVELYVPVEAIDEAFAQRTEDFHVAAQDASFDVPREPPTTLDDQNDTSWTPVPATVRVVPATNGRAFDASLASTQVSELLREGTREAELRLRVLEPAFTTEDARALGIDHLIGTFTTYHACCQSRVVNIHRLADMVDGTVIEPGEQFSVNQISGERTCDKGFRPAGMILAGKLVDSCGGGVSQFGTTTFNAAFFAGLPIDQYKAHSWYISRYPMGREATLNYPSPDIDVRWTNDTDHGILVKTSYTGTSITVSLYGDNGGETVSAVHGQPTNYRGYSTRYQEDKSLPPGSQRRIQSGAQGFDVVVFRVIEVDGEEVERERFFTRYVPIPEIIARNSDPAPPPPPPPPPDDGGDASPPPDEGQ